MPNPVLLSSLFGELTKHVQALMAIQSKYTSKQVLIAVQ